MRGPSFKGKHRLWAEATAGLVVSLCHVLFHLAETACQCKGAGNGADGLHTILGPCPHFQSAPSTLCLHWETKTTENHVPHLALAVSPNLEH